MRRDGVVIAGVSTRALAESAWRAGFACETVDAFGDLDQKARVRSISFHHDLGRRYNAGAAAAVARRLSARAAAYVSNFENHPDAICRLAAGRVLLGNPPEVLDRARDPFLLADVVAAAGARAPLTLRPSDAWRADAGRAWLRKPIRGGGGSGVRPWKPGLPLGLHEIAQEYIDGVSASMVFLADGQNAILLGLSRQLTGAESTTGALSRPRHPDPLSLEGERECSPYASRSRGLESSFGAPPFRYEGSLYPLCTPNSDRGADSVASAPMDDRAAAVAAAVTAAFGLRGINGVDFVLRDGELVVLELNPRYPASAELIERATGLSIFEAHAEACLGHIPTACSDHAPLGARSARLPTVWGKAILYAPCDIVMGDTRALLDDDRVRDIPFPGERIRRGHPICTVFADGASQSACHARLAEATQVVERLLGSTNPA